MPEFRHITWIRKRLDADPRVMIGPGDDTALVATAPSGMLATVDAAIGAYQQALDPVVRQSRLIGPATIDLVIPNSRRQIWLIAQALRFLPRLPDRLRRRLTAAGGSPAAMLSEAALTRPDDVPH